METSYYRVKEMSTAKHAIRRSARRIGVEQGANFEKRREIILRVAAREFNQKGIQNTSLDDIAARLRVTKPALYHYVSSKDEMIRQCLEMAMTENGKLLDSVNGLNATGLGKLQYVFERWAANATTDFGRGMVLIEPHSLSDESRKTHLDSHRLILRSVEAIIEEGIRDNSVRKCNPAVMALGLMGVFNSPARWFRSQGPLSLEEAVAELIGLMKNGIATDTH